MLNLGKDSSSAWSCAYELGSDVREVDVEIALQASMGRSPNFLRSNSVLQAMKTFKCRIRVDAQNLMAAVSSPVPVPPVSKERYTTMRTELDAHMHAAKRTHMVALMESVQMGFLVRRHTDAEVCFVHFAGED